MNNATVLFLFNSHIFPDAQPESSVNQDAAAYLLDLGLIEKSIHGIDRAYTTTEKGSMTVNKIRRLMELDARGEQVFTLHKYKTFGKYVIDEFQQELPLEQALMAAHNYSIPWANKKPIKMIVHTECEPIEYSFGCYKDEGGIPINPENDETHNAGCAWHEICRVQRV